MDEEAKFCRLCGIKFIYLKVGYGPYKDLCYQCYSGKSSQAKKEKYFQEFAKHPVFQNVNFQADNLYCPLPKLIVGSFIILAFILLPILLVQMKLLLVMHPSGTTWYSIGLAFVGKAVAKRILFSKAKFIDKQRWIHYSNGLLLGFWISTIVVAALGFQLLFIDHKSTDLWPRYIVQDHILEAIFYLCAFPLGSIVALYNLKRSDKKEIRRIMEYHELWKSENS